MENNELEITKEEFDALVAEKESLKQALKLEREEKKEWKAKATEAPVQVETQPAPAPTVAVEEIVSKALEAERQQTAFKQDLEEVVEEDLRDEVLATMNTMFKEIPNDPVQRRTLMKVSRDYLVQSKLSGSTITNALAGADSSRGNKNLSPEKEENPYLSEKDRSFHEGLRNAGRKYLKNQ
jgi:hypothetical protein